MPIQVDCPHCGRNYRLKDELAGKKFRCSECQKVVTAPTLEQPSKPVRTARKVGKSESLSSGTEESAKGDEKTHSTSRPASRSSSGGNVRRETPSASESPRKPDRTRRRSKPEPEYEIIESEDSGFEGLDSYGSDDNGWNDPYSQEDPYAEAPAPKSSSRKSAKSRAARSGGGWSVGFNLGRLNLAMVVIGFCLLMIGGMELSLSRKSNATPVPISLAELLQNGPGSNVYFTVSGVQPASDEFVYEERGGTRKYYSKVYFACQPFGMGNAAPVRFVLMSTNAKDDFAVNNLMQQTTHTGMITNSIRRLGSEERQLLQSAAPGANLNEALIFEAGRQPSSAVKYLSLIVGGLGLLLGGLAWIFVRTS